MSARTWVIVLCASLAVMTHAAPLPADTVDGALVADMIARSEPGVTVRVSAATVVLAGTLRLKPGVTLQGAGFDKTILRLAPDAKPGALLDLSDCDGAGVRDLGLDGVLQPNAHRGIVAGRARDLHIQRVAIRNFVKGSGPHAIAFSGTNPTRADGVTDSEIRDCVIDTIGVGDPWGCGIRMSWGSSRNRVIHNTIRHTGRGGIFGNDGSTDLVIRDNTVSDSGGEGLGIEVWGGCERALIEHNVIDHWLSVDSSSHSAIRHNVVSDKTGVIKGLGLEDVAASYCVFTDNVVDDGQGIGLSASNRPAKNYTFWGFNRFVGCNQWGAQLQGEEGGVGWHYFYRCQFNDNPTGKGQPRYPNDAGHGFRTNGNCHHLTLEECEFNGNGSLGLQLGGGAIDALNFIRCTIRGNHGAAVSGPGAYTALEWHDCIVEGNGSNALPAAKPFPAPAPTASFTPPLELTAGQPAAFESTSKAAAGEIATCLWDFGDGLPADGPKAQHAFALPGRYRVTLIVWDAAGCAARAERSVQVR